MRSCCEQTMHSTIHGEDIVPCSHCPPPAYHHESRPAINDALFITVILVEPCSYRPAGIWTCLILGKLLWTQSRRFFSSSHVTLQCFVKTPFETIDKAGDFSPGRSRSWTSSCCSGATWCPGATPQENPIDLFQAITRKPCTSHENNSKTWQRKPSCF